MFRKSSLCIILMVGVSLNFVHFTQAGSASSNQTNLTVCDERQNHTTHEKHTAVGFIGAIVAVLMFGSNFVPVKKIPTGDGVFFQWILCMGIWFFGLIIHISGQTNMKFYPLVMVGGAIWCTGNMCVVPIIKTIGLAMGLLIWCVLNLLAGWATGRFGTFGLICPQHVQHSVLNYVGVILALISLVIFIFIKNEDTPVDARPDPVVNDIKDSNVRYNRHINESELTEDETSSLLRHEDKGEDASWLDNLSPRRKRFIGILLSVISGVFYGISFTPMYIVQKMDRDAPDNGRDYVFSQFCGILMTSTIYFLIYCIYKRNKPDIFPSAIAPGFLSGIMWAIGAVGWFIANTELSEPVSFPIVTTGPGIIAAVWGIIMFKEIKGIRNFLILGIAFCVQLTGAILTGFSNAK